MLFASRYLVLPLFASHSSASSLFPALWNYFKLQSNNCGATIEQKCKSSNIPRPDCQFTMKIHEIVPKNASNISIISVCKLKKELPL